MTVKDVIINIFHKMVKAKDVFFEDIYEICDEEYFTVSDSEEYMTLTYLDSNKKSERNIYNLSSPSNCAKALAQIDIISVKDISLKMFMDIYYLHQRSKDTPNKEAISSYKKLMDTYEKVSNLENKYKFFNLKIGNLHTDSMAFEPYDDVSYEFYVKCHFTIDYKEIFELLKKGNEE